MRDKFFPIKINFRFVRFVKFAQSVGKLFENRKLLFFIEFQPFFPRHQFAFDLRRDEIFVIFDLAESDNFGNFQTRPRIFERSFFTFDLMFGRKVNFYNEIFINEKNDTLALFGAG